MPCRKYRLKTAAKLIGVEISESDRCLPASG